MEGPFRTQRGLRQLLVSLRQNHRPVGKVGGDLAGREPRRIELVEVAVHASSQFLHRSDLAVRYLQLAR